MKTLRDDARRRILDAACDEFLTNGYAGASMRTIAKQAGMTVGNIYIYFTGKDKLFEAIVHETLTQLRALLGMPAGENMLGVLVSGLQAIFIRSRVPFLILISHAEGSHFEGLKEHIVAVAEGRMRELLPEADKGLAGPLSAAVVQGLVAMFDRFDGDEEGLSADLFRFLNYMLRGLMPEGPMEGICEA